ncbi:hypothetical protein Vi05172_g4338 [Venturia inaequalis]|nr:hypothetical protein Vi05172_g4338 [Venturia inaequalis]
MSKMGYRKTKPTTKPGLDAVQKQQRLAWCLKHQDWTLEQWKDVIWSDETSVVLGVRRGGARVWRKPSQVVQTRCIRPRWKSASEFMFWGCFSYDMKGPCHIWKPETKAEKDLAAAQLDRMNSAKESEAKAKWEEEQAYLRATTTRRGRRAKWKFTKKRGAYVRDGKGGIDWWRYIHTIVTPKMIPFARRCRMARPNTLVQEDNAPSHAHKHTSQVYSVSGIMRLLWPGNSPDLNMIEVCWRWMKWKICKAKGGPPKTAVNAKKVWENTWKELKQEKIQGWIERIMTHVKKVIECEGGNEYVEGRDKEVERADEDGKVWVKKERNPRAGRKMK